MSLSARTLPLVGALAVVVGCASPPPATDSGERDVAGTRPASEARPAPEPKAAPAPVPAPEPEPEPEPACIDIVVAAGEHDRAQTPVSVAVAIPEALAKCRAVKVVAKDGVVLAGQITAPALLSEPPEPPAASVAREVQFVLPRLAAGKELALRVELEGDAPPAPAAFAWHEEAGKHFELRLGGRPVLRYMCETLDPARREETYKVFHHVYSPDGSQIVTKGHGGRYTHHRGIFYGFSKTTYDGNQRVDIWHCKGDTHQAHAKVLATEVGPVLGRHRVQVEWRGNGGKVFAVEERELGVWNVPGGVLVGFASRIKSTGGKVTFDGDPQHAGFHFRASNEVAAKTAKQTYYLRPDGKDAPRKTRNWPGQKDHVDLAWNAMSFVLGETRFTACYLDRPENPKEARFSERDYGRFGSYFKHELDEGKTLDVAYRIWLQEGETTVEGVAAKSADLNAPPSVRVVKGP